MLCSEESKHLSLFHLIWPRDPSSFLALSFLQASLDHTPKDFSHVIPCLQQTVPTFWPIRFLRHCPHTLTFHTDSSSEHGAFPEVHVPTLVSATHCYLHHALPPSPGAALLTSGQCTAPRKLEGERKTSLCYLRVRRK